MKVIEMVVVEAKMKLYELKGKGMELGLKWVQLTQRERHAFKCQSRDAVPEEFVLQLKGKEKLLFITVAEVQLGFLTLCRVKIMLYLPQHLLVTHYMV